MITPATPFEHLSPDCVLDAVDSQGLRTDGRLLALNSYENRVYRVGIEDAPPIVAKIYRPNRWTDAQILEEHAFARELVEAEVPLVAPLTNSAGETLIHYAGFRFALFPLAYGRPPDLEQLDTLEWLGRFIGRLHSVGRRQPFRERLHLTPRSYGHASVAWLQASDFIPADLRPAYDAISCDVLTKIDAIYAAHATITTLRIHGDCHPGNLLWGQEGPLFVDLDDCLMGPAIQDLWMLLSGSTAEQTEQLDAVLEGYREFQDFDLRELRLVEPLRTLRMLHYAAWLARRWSDPAFPRNFPWFNTQRYWQDHILALREQSALLDEPPLSLY